MTRILLFLSCLVFPILCLATPTYFGSATNPADDSTDGSATLSVTPPPSMTTGDLVVLTSFSRGSSTGTITISEAGGQTWNSLTAVDVTAGTATARVFWCTYNGTWSANPSVNTTVTSVAAHTVVMHVFRPTIGSDTWAVDNAWSGTTYVAPSTPFTVSITGVDPSNVGTVTFAMWASLDNNTWGSLTGSDWSTTGIAQYRNQGGSDTALTFAHKLTDGAVNTSKNQSTLGGDAGVNGIVSFYESSSATPTPTPTPGGAVLVDLIQPVGVIPFPR